LSVAPRPTVTRYESKMRDALACPTHGQPLIYLRMNGRDFLRKTRSPGILLCSLIPDVEGAGRGGTGGPRIAACGVPKPVGGLAIGVAVRALLHGDMT